MKLTSDEYAPYFETYVRLVQENALTALKNQQQSTLDFLSQISEERGLLRYAEGKWTVKEVFGHIIDCERIMAYRALRIARNDQTPLAGFDENAYIANSEFNSRHFGDIAEEYALLRQSNLALFQSFSEDALLRSGTANGKSVSVRALLAIIAGHELHHLNILRERYFK